MAEIDGEFALHVQLQSYEKPNAISDTNALAIFRAAVGTSLGGKIIVRSRNERLEFILMRDCHNPLCLPYIKSEHIGDAGSSPRNNARSAVRCTRVQRQSRTHLIPVRLGRSRIIMIDGRAVHVSETFRCNDARLTADTVSPWF